MLDRFTWLRCTGTRAGVEMTLYCDVRSSFRVNKEQKICYNVLIEDHDACHSTANINSD